MRTIGVISDTHDLLRPEALEALEGSDLILHAGDVGGLEILQGLERIAPVRAVRGNTDYGATASALPHDDMVDLGADGGRLDGEAVGPLAYLLHELDHLDLDPAAAGVAIVVYGHTHRPALERRGGVLFFNPGAAGRRRFDLPVTIGRLTIRGGELEVEVVELEVG